MKLSLKSCRSLLLTSAALVIAAALAIAVGVIPAVKADTFPRATPERAALAFEVVVGLSLLTRF
jgi:ABC-type dipeptide/oligopeptide/nickel transport system permease component